MPPGENTEDEDDDPLSGLKSGIVKAKGKSVFVETTAGAFGADTRDAPREDWKQKRLGPALRMRSSRGCTTSPRTRS